jgi:hypothetical protein
MERRLVMIRTIREKMGDILETWDSEAGMHTVGWLPPHVYDSEVCGGRQGGRLCHAAI